MKRMINVYIGLHRPDGSEPPEEAGYSRVDAGEFDLWDLQKVPHQAQIVFPDVIGPGYGSVAEYAIYDQAEGGRPLMVWRLPEPVECHAGTIPFIHLGKLYRGMDVSAKVTLMSGNETKAKAIEGGIINGN